MTTRFPTDRVSGRRPHYAALILTTLLSVLPRGFSQTPPAAGANDDVTRLPTFRVETEKDVGYIAADTISGGRLSTNVLKTPSDLTVLTREFLDDVGINDLNQAGLGSPVPP